MVTSRRHTPKLRAPLAVAAKDRLAGRPVAQSVAIIDVGSVAPNPATRQMWGATAGTPIAPASQQRTPVEPGVHAIEFRPATRIFASMTLGARLPARLPSKLTQE